MLHEYAVAPEVIATWTDRTEGRYFIEKFGIGTPRIISRYPRKRWVKLVWDAWKARQADEGPNRLSRDDKRLEELIAVLSHTMVRRREALWDSDRSWLENALEENDRIAFHAILAADNAKDDPAVLVAGAVDYQTPRWKIPDRRTVPRQATSIANVMRDMLRAATDIVFVDPHFTAHHSRYRNAIGACVWASAAQRAVGPVTIRILCSTKAHEDKSESPEHFADGCRSLLPADVPEGQEIAIWRLSERPGGEKLHNRYILTEHGGVLFGAGLDEGKPGSTDELALLDREQYRQRWNQYASDQPAFDRPEDVITIVGTGRSPRDRRSNTR